MTREAESPDRTASPRRKRSATGFIVAGLIIVAVTVACFRYATTGAREAAGPGSGSAQILAAQEDGLPAWLLFHSKTCQSCREMEATFNQLRPDFEGKVAFVNIDVNDPAEEGLVREYGIEYIPTTFLLDRSGARVASAVGTVLVDDLRAALNELVRTR